MAAAGRSAVTLGGKGSSLTSSSVFGVANGFAHVFIDSSVLSGRSSSSSTTSAAEFRFSIPDFLTPEEARASVIPLLNNLVLSSSSSAACAQLVEILNKNVVSPGYTLNDVTSDDLAVLDYSSAAIAGVSALVDHRCSALASIADAVAALSCEALRADVSPFNLMDSGDGLSPKDAVAVAANFRVFFNGSKLVNSGKKQFSDSSVAEIPLVHGSFWEFSRLLHSKTRVELNSGFRAGSAKAMSTALLSLALSLSNLGDNSVRRTGLLVSSSISDVELRSRLSEMVAAKCLRVELHSRMSEILAAKCLLPESSSQEHYLLFSHKLYELLDVVRNIVSWEAIAAFVSLEGCETFADRIQPDNSSLSEPDKKSEKKRKVVVLGKGTTAIMQYIKGRVLCPTPKYDLEKCSQDFQSLLDPKGSGFDDLLAEVKEIVESNENRRLPKLPKGTRDFSKEQMAIREKAFAIIVEVFKRHGGMALHTPVFELKEVVTGKYGEDSKLIYDLADQGGELCSLRYDLTVPFVRYVAMNGLTSFKRYQIAQAYRRDNPSKGRYREFYQCDFDIAGQFEKMGPDFEVIKILTELLDELGIGDYEVKLNHRKLLDGMLVICGVPQEKFRTICSSIDKLDKQSFEQVKREMVEEKGLAEETADKIGSFVKQRGSPMELLSQLKKEGSEFLSNGESNLALNELEILFKALQKAKFINKVVFDLSLAKGLDYYTGVIFEAVFKGGTQVGSIAAGGRYDNLIGMFGRKQVPSVGVSLGIERVFVIMEQLQKDKNQEIRATEIQVLVSILVDDLSLGTELASELWEAKLKAEFMVNKKLSKHVDRAKGSKIPYMAIVGDYELSKGVVKLKDTTDMTWEDVPRSRLVPALQTRLGISP